jgi:hypothetical protein
MWRLRLLNSLRGLSSREAALLLVIGLVLGVFPMVGVPTVLCLVAAFRFRLNLGVLQLINSVSSPVQLILLVPLERVGAFLCRGTWFAGASSAGKIPLFAMHAIAGWACLCIPGGVLLYLVVLRGGRIRSLPSLRLPLK